MWEKKEILILLTRSKLFTDKMRKQIETYIDNLSISQLEGIHQALKTEKILLLQFLKSLKTSWDMSYEEIKTIKENVSRKKRQELEISEESESKESLNNLLLSIENL